VVAHCERAQLTVVAATVGVGNPGKSLAARSASAVPSPSATPCQPEPRTIATSWGGAPAQRFTSAAASAASSNGSHVAFAAVIERKARSDTLARHALRRGAQSPTGCHTVFVSRNASIRRGVGASAQSGSHACGSSTRFTLLTAARSSSTTSEAARPSDRVRRRRMGGEHRRELGYLAGEQVHDASGKVRCGEHLSKGDGRQGPRLTGKEHGRVPVAITGASTLTSPRARRLRRDHSTTRWARAR